MWRNSERTKLKTASFHMATEFLLSSLSNYHKRGRNPGLVSAFIKDKGQGDQMHFSPPTGMQYHSHTGAGFLLTLRRSERMKPKLRGEIWATFRCFHTRQEAGKHQQHSLQAHNALSSGVCVIIFCLQFNNLGGCG